MQDEPTPAELVKAVAEFLRADVMPQLTGHAAFKLRVGANALDLVVRQLTLSDTSHADELTRLTQILGLHGTLDDLNRDFADGIAKGEMGQDGPGIADHLWQTTMEKLAVDQPNYASYRREVGQRNKDTASS